MPSITVCSLNMWVCAGDFEKRWPCLLAALKAESHVDLFVLQENARYSGFDSQSTIERLAVELGMEARFGWHWNSGHKLWQSMGNGYLSRLPILGFEDRSLQDPTERHTTGGLAAADLQDPESVELHSQLRLEVELPNGQPWSIYNCHLPHRSIDSMNRETQVVAMAQWAAEIEHVVSPIWCGDFNTSPSSSTYRFVTGEQSLHGRSTCWTDLKSAFSDGEHLPTIGRTIPRVACVDYIFQRQHSGMDNAISMPCRSCGLVFNEPCGPHQMLPSDHCAVRATFDLEAGG